MTAETMRERIARIIDPPAWQPVEENVGSYNEARMRRIDRQNVRRRASERKADRILAELGGGLPIDQAPVGEPVLVYVEPWGWMQGTLSERFGTWMVGARGIIGRNLPEAVEPTRFMFLPPSPEADRG